MGGVAVEIDLHAVADRRSARIVDALVTFPAHAPVAAVDVVAAFEATVRLRIANARAIIVGHAFDADPGSQLAHPFRAIIVLGAVIAEGAAVATYIAVAWAEPAITAAARRIEAASADEQAGEHHERSRCHLDRVAKIRPPTPKDRQEPV
jgi:hypothetical protein